MMEAADQDVEGWTVHEMNALLVKTGKPVRFVLHRGQRDDDF